MGHHSLYRIRKRSKDQSSTSRMQLLVSVFACTSLFVGFIDGFESSCIRFLPRFQTTTSSLPIRSTTRDPKLYSTSRKTSSSSTASSNDRRQQSLEQGNDPLISLNINLDALAKSKAAPRAQELLQRIHALYQEGYYEVSPDVVSYNSVLKAWKEQDDPDKAYELLQDMILHSQEANEYDGGGVFSDLSLGGDSVEYVDVISFNTVILAYAKQGNCPKAEDLLRRMQHTPNLPSPDAVTYNSVLYAYAQSNDDGTPILAENLLKEMMHDTTKSEVIVDTTTFNTVIHGWARTVSLQNGPGPANRAQRLLDHMEQLSAAGNPNVLPDEYSYTTVIQAWARCGEPTKAQTLLERMTARDLTPNRFTYTAVMSALAKSGKPERAEEILNEMMEAYEYGNDDLKPDTVAFSSVIDGWAKLSSVDKPHAGDHAERLFHQMQKLKDQDMGPNARTYTSVMTALAKSGTWEACDKARALLDEMESEFLEHGQKQLRPTTIHYNTVLLAYARSPRADKALKANGFLRNTMLQHPNSRCRPDTISYNSLLMSCANAFGNAELKEKSFAIALWAFKEVCTSTSKEPQSIDKDKNSNILRPTSTTFAHFCKASRRLLPSRQQQQIVLQKTLKLCCEKGLLSPVIVQQIQTACKSDKDWQIVAAGSLAEYMTYKDRFNKNKLPPSWTVHARR